MPRLITTLALMLTAFALWTVGATAAARAIAAGGVAFALAAPFLMKPRLLGRLVFPACAAGAFVLLLAPLAYAGAGEAAAGFMGLEVFGISLVTLALGILAGVYMALKRIAPKTDTEWDDSVLDVIEGACDTLGVDPDELAKRSFGRLKKKVLK